MGDFEPGEVLVVTEQLGMSEVLEGSLQVSRAKRLSGPSSISISFILKIVIGTGIGFRGTASTLGT